MKRLVQSVLIARVGVILILVLLSLDVLELLLVKHRVVPIPALSCFLWQLSVLLGLFLVAEQIFGNYCFWYIILANLRLFIIHVFILLDGFL